MGSKQKAKITSLSINPEKRKTLISLISRDPPSKQQSNNYPSSLVTSVNLQDYFYKDKLRKAEQEIKEEDQLLQEKQLGIYEKPKIQLVNHRRHATQAQVTEKSGARVRESSKKRIVIKQIIQQLDGKDQEIQASDSTGRSAIFHDVQDNIFDSFLRNELSQQQKEALDYKVVETQQVSAIESTPNYLVKKLDPRGILINGLKVSHTTPSTPTKKFEQISFMKFENAVNTEQPSISTQNENKINPQLIQQAAHKITFKEAMTILKIARVDKAEGEKELKKVILSKKQQAETRKVQISHQEQMNDIIKGMQERDCEGNIIKYQEEMNSLQKQKNINTNARLSHCQLANIRRLVPKAYIKNSLDFDRINITMLNEYLNKYSEKLSRGNAQDPFEIKVDFQKYDEILTGVEGQTYNPYFIVIDQEKDEKEAPKIVESRYLNHFSKKDQDFKRLNPIAAKQQEKRLMKEINDEVKGIKKKYEPPMSKNRRLYMRSIDINRFENYENMIKSLRPRTNEIKTIQVESDYYPDMTKTIGSNWTKVELNRQLKSQSVRNKTAGASTEAQTRIMSPVTSQLRVFSPCQSGCYYTPKDKEGSARSSLIDDKCKNMLFQEYSIENWGDMEGQLGNEERKQKVQANIREEISQLFSRNELIELISQPKPKQSQEIVRKDQI